MREMNCLQLESWMWFAWAGYWMYASRSTQRTKSSESSLLRLQHMAPTFLSFILIVWPQILGFLPHEIGFSFFVQAVGAALTATGLLFAVWARTHLGKYWSGTITLKEGHRLIRTGPYRLSRHPIYTGFLLAVLGSALSAGTFEALLALVIVIVAYLIKIRREEIVLVKEFGDEYATFRKQTKMLIPFIA